MATFPTNGSDAIRFTWGNPINALGGLDTILFDLPGVANLNVTFTSATSATATFLYNGVATTRSMTNIEGIFGSTANDVITGGAGTQSLKGFDGNDVLNGGAGSDCLYGGRGNDTFYVDSGAEIVADDLAGAAGGIDTILSYVNDAAWVQGPTQDINGNPVAPSLDPPTGLGFLMLPGQFIENVRIMFAGNSSVFGNEKDTTFFAGPGNNRINGWLGSDTASYLYAASGVIVSLALAAPQATGGSGTDTLSFIENLTGSTKADTLAGSSGANGLRGLQGADTLRGNGGADRFIYLAVAEGGDRISDFSGDDVIVLKGSAFGGLTNANKFANLVVRNGSTNAADPNDRLIFDQSQDQLWYDSNGSNLGGTRIMIADLTNGFHLTAADIVIV